VELPAQVESGGREGSVKRTKATSTMRDMDTPIPSTERDVEPSEIPRIGSPVLIADSQSSPTRHRE
jgi:hypothetical protein